MSYPASDHLLRTFAAVPPSCRVLDADAGSGYRTEALAMLGFDIHASDEDAAAVSLLRESLSALDAREQRFIQARSGALGYPDDYFDWVVADRSEFENDSLESTLDVLLELRRVLKPGGWLYLVLPTGAVSEETTDEECTLGFYRLAAEAGLELAEKAEIENHADRRVVRGIFRRVESNTPV
jgi:ubiquinone/menaquinone biosynthesis C-methylase UbiE